MTRASARREASAVCQSVRDNPHHAGSGTKKVCFISPLGFGLYNPGTGYPFGGAEVQAYWSARELARDPAYKVSVLVTVDEPPGVGQHSSITVIRRQAKARLASNRLTVGAASGWVRSFIEMLRQLRSIDADVFLHAGAGIEVGAYALMCRLLGRRFVFVIASTADLSLAHGGVQGPLKWLYPLGVRLADAVVCRTMDQQAALRERYGRAGMVIRTAHPVLPETDRERTSVLWVGRIHPVKQPLLFLDLAEQLPDCSCVLVGMRDEAHADLWDAVQRRTAGLRHVAFHADLPLPVAGESFHAAKVFVNTSVHEGFPNTFAQAALNGVPIVSWSVDPDGILSGGRIGFCAEQSFERLVFSVRRLCTDERLHEEYRRRARAYGIENHSLDESMSRLKRLLDSLSSFEIGALRPRA
jgi:glycosyltransferase involved in cell wall biosynthesis